MTIHTNVDPRTIERIAADVRQLVDPIEVVTRQARRAGSVRWSAVTHPPLLHQLAAACEPGSTIRGPERHTGPKSQPAANLDAVHARATLLRELDTWRRAVLAEPSTTLRALAAVAVDLAPSLADNLAHDVHRWWHSAAVHSGWRPEDLETAR